MIEKIKLNENERLEDLGDDLYIIQDKTKFKFGVDAVLLADFCKNSIKRKSRICEVGTGSGIIPLLLSKKSTLQHIDAFEIQEPVARLAQRSVELNHLEDKIVIHNQDIKEQDIFKPNSLDIVISNPPYFSLQNEKKPSNREIVNPDESIAISRHELKLTLEELLDFSYKYLRQGGKLFMIYRPFRFAEMVSKAKERHLITKKVRFVYPRVGKEATMVLVELTKEGKEYLKVESPLFIYEGQDYSEEIIKIYGNNHSVRKVIAEN